MGVAHQLATIGGIALALAIASKICSFDFVCLQKAHINLSGMQRVYGLMGWKCSDNKFQVLTNI